MVGLWMSRFERGVTITAVWKDEAHAELWRAESSPLTADELEPIFGPGWTSYAPLGLGRSDETAA
jgi:hypothetical protein